MRDAYSDSTVPSASLRTAAAASTARLPLPPPRENFTRSQSATVAASGLRLRPASSAPEHTRSFQWARCPKRQDRDRGSDRWRPSPAWASHMSLGTSRALPQGTLCAVSSFLFSALRAVVSIAGATEGVFARECAAAEVLKGTIPGRGAALARDWLMRPSCRLYACMRECAHQRANANLRRAMRPFSTRLTNLAASIAFFTAAAASAARVDSVACAARRILSLPAISWAAELARVVASIPSSAP
mmetsp:Transcript_30870/g.77312  ORF Transcript_30870/g.77312 Transcript_30870/m.77312 type:complete len:244 (+) Transcript_30870:2153-2884(+)